MKKLITILSLVLMTSVFVSCDFFEDHSNNEFDTYQWEPVASPTHQDTVVDSIADEYFNLNPPFYLVTLQIKQSTFTLDIGEHIKNKANAIEVTIAVDKRFYDSVEVGQEISDEFKLGSMLFDGDFSKLKIRIARKQIVKK